MTTEQRPPETPSWSGIMRAVSWLGAGHAASQIVWYASLIVLAALLPPAALGVVAVGMVIVQVAWMATDSGIGGSLVVGRALSRAELRGATRFNVALGLVLAAAVAAAAGPIVDSAARGGDPNVLRALAVGIVVYALAVVPLALLQKRLRFKAYAFVMATSATVAAVAGVALGFAGAGVWSFVARQVLFQALIATFAWIAARGLLPPRDEGGTARLPWFRPPQAGAFVVVTLTNFLAFNLDYIVVGRFTDAHQVGLYALAFTIAFAPLTQVAAQIGRVVRSAAAATADRAIVGARTLAGMRAVAVLLFPFAPAAVVLAPPVFPAVLGEEWAPMVAPFQILVCVGVGHAVLEILATALAGAGAMPWRAKVGIPWLGAMVVALVVLVHLYGIRGAAIAHAALFVPLAIVYVVIGSRRIGIDAPRIWRALRGVVLVVAVQSAVTALVVWAVPGDASAAVTGAAAGLAVAAAALWRPAELRRLRPAH